MKSHAISVPREYPEKHAQHSTAAGDAFVDAYLPALLAQAHDRVASAFHPVAAEHGIGPSEWRVLATLASGTPESIGRLAEIVVIKQPTLTRLLDRMEATGHVRRVPHDGDRRITLVNITPHGQAVVDRLVPLAREYEARVLAPFGLRRSSALKEALMELIAQDVRP
jgi:DNA-binding MarR family transcriptional regulator